MTFMEHRRYFSEQRHRELFTNLKNNAVQAMANGGQLAIEGHRDNEMVCVSVVDTGNGVSKENLDKIFEPLFTTKAKGTGLGITVCKRVTEAHRGTILENQPRAWVRVSPWYYQ
jgi:signal transduction histidine kinase